MNLIQQKNNKYFFDSIFNTSEFNFVKKWIKKLNSYFADFEKVKKCWTNHKNASYFATLSYLHKNVISYFADFKLLVDRLFFLDDCFYLFYCFVNSTWNGFQLIGLLKSLPGFEPANHLLAAGFFIHLASEWYNLR